VVMFLVFAAGLGLFRVSCFSAAWELERLEEHPSCMQVKVQALQEERITAIRRVLAQRSGLRRR
jgi:hypothetical protein